MLYSPGIFGNKEVYLISLIPHIYLVNLSIPIPNPAEGYIPLLTIDRYGE